MSREEEIACDVFGINGPQLEEIKKNQPEKYEHFMEMLKKNEAELREVQTREDKILKLVEYNKLLPLQDEVADSIFQIIGMASYVSSNNEIKTFGEFAKFTYGISRNISKLNLSSQAAGGFGNLLKTMAGAATLASTVTGITGGVVSIIALFQENKAQNALLAIENNLNKIAEGIDVIIQGLEHIDKRIVYSEQRLSTQISASTNRLGEQFSTGFSRLYRSTAILDNYTRKFCVSNEVYFKSILDKLEASTILSHNEHCLMVLNPIKIEVNRARELLDLKESDFNRFRESYGVASILYNLKYYLLNDCCSPMLNGAFLFDKTPQRSLNIFEGQREQEALIFIGYIAKWLESMGVNFRVPYKTIPAIDTNTLLNMPLFNEVLEVYIDLSRRLDNFSERALKDNEDILERIQNTQNFIERVQSDPEIVRAFTRKQKELLIAFFKKIKERAVRVNGVDLYPWCPVQEMLDRFDAVTELQAKMVNLKVSGHSRGGMTFEMDGYSKPVDTIQWNGDKWSRANGAVTGDPISIFFTKAMSFIGFFMKNKPIISCEKMDQPPESSFTSIGRGFITNRNNVEYHALRFNFQDAFFSSSCRCTVPIIKREWFYDSGRFQKHVLILLDPKYSRGYFDTTKQIENKALEIIHQLRRENADFSDEVEHKAVVAGDCLITLLYQLFGIYTDRRELLNEHSLQILDGFEFFLDDIGRKKLPGYKLKEDFTQVNPDVVNEYQLIRQQPMYCSTRLLSAGCSAMQRKMEMHSAMMRLHHSLAPSKEDEKEKGKEKEESLFDSGSVFFSKAPQQADPFEKTKKLAEECPGCLLQINYERQEDGSEAIKIFVANLDELIYGSELQKNFRASINELKNHFVSKFNLKYHPSSGFFIKPSLKDEHISMRITGSESALNSIYSELLSVRKLFEQEVEMMTEKSFECKLM